MSEGEEEKGREGGGSVGGGWCACGGEGETNTLLDSVVKRHCLGGKLMVAQLEAVTLVRICGFCA